MPSDPFGTDPDAQLTTEQQAQVDRLTTVQLAKIDEALLSVVNATWQKQALIIGQVMIATHCKQLELPDVFYSTRLKFLVEQKKLTAMGNLNHMRYSELKLAGPH